jgi:hypothetical protein
VKQDYKGLDSSIMSESFYERRYGHRPEFQEGRQTAQRDIKAERFKLHLYGDFNPAFPHFERLLRERHGLDLEWDFRGEFGFNAWIAGYDNEVNKEFTQRLGEHTLEALWREAEMILKQTNSGQDVNDRERR